MFDALKRAVAGSFLDGIYNKTSRLYFFFGQTTEPIDLVEEDSVDYINHTKNNIFAIKEVLPSDVSFVITRKNYVPDIEYNPYNGESGEGDYVYNPNNFSVYICVKRGEGNSTVEPNHLTTVPMTLGDGYTWRYIYTIPLAMRDRFLTSDWIPVSNSLSENYFSNGGIDSVSIIDSGADYDANTTSIVVVGASNKGHGAILEPVVSEGKIVSVIIHDPGYGYISPTIVVSSPVATREAKITANISKGDIRSSQALIQTLAVPGTIERIDILDGGEGYTEDVTIGLRGDGSGATISFVRNSTTGAIESILVLDRGENYTWAELVVEDTPLVGGSGLVADIILSPLQGFGRDAVSDLNATSIMIYQNLSREKIEGLTLENKLYQFGIISGPKSTTNSISPKSQVTKNNYTTSIPFNQISQYSPGTLVYNEFPVTANTKEFIVEEQIVGVRSAGIRLRALNSGRISSGVRYFKDSTTSFVADYLDYSLSTDRQFVSACFVLRTTSPNFFDTNTFSVGKELSSGGHKYIIVASSSDTILVSSVDGGNLITGDVLQDEASNTLTPESIDSPVFDKKTGRLITIELSDVPITYGQSQSVSFRTVVEF